MCRTSMPTFHQLGETGRNQRQTLVATASTRRVRQNSTAESTDHRGSQELYYRPRRGVVQEVRRGTTARRVRDTIQNIQRQGLGPTMEGKANSSSSASGLHCSQQRTGHMDASTNPDLPPAKAVTLRPTAAKRKRTRKGGNGNHR